MADFDFGELDQLAADLGDVTDNAGPNVSKAIGITSLKVKKAWQGRLDGSSTLPGLPSAVTYDITTFQGFGVSVIKSEIGFEKDRRQGALGNFSEFGTPKVPGRGYGLAALEENQKDFEDGLAIALRQAERSAGL
jgi:hypothetical protein